MANVSTHELAYSIESRIVRRLRSLKIPRAKWIADDLVPEIMQDIPSEAFFMKPVWELGVLFFHGEVTEEYVREMQFEILETHSNIKKELPLTIYLSSIGGSPEAGMALFSTVQEVRRAGRRVNCHVQGLAASMGSVLLQACDVRTIEPFAYLMIHESYDEPFGKTSHLKDYVAFLERYDGILSATYATRSGKPVEYWREKMLRRDVYLTAREAVTEGLVDRIRPVPPYTSKRRKTRASEPAS